MVRKYSNVQGYKFSHVENLDDNASSAHQTGGVYVLHGVAGLAPP